MTLRIIQRDSGVASEELCAEGVLDIPKIIARGGIGVRKYFGVMEKSVWSDEKDCHRVKMAVAMELCGDLDNRMSWMGMRNGHFVLRRLFEMRHGCFKGKLGV